MTRRHTPDRFRQVDALFDAALDLPTGERDAYLVRAAGADTALLDEVRQLLAAHRASSEFLADAAQPEGAALLRETWDASTRPALTRVGPFRVMREVGRGGMGAVYLAERDDAQFEQRVALKVVRGLGVDASLVKRFLAERRILARLEHRHIARLLDGGVTDDGTPWFAMEYVEGERIDRWCDSRSLPIDARLRLFADTCEAVQYAHGQLVVHRDLKPSNIMVTASGELKLLDFGVARLLTAQDLEATHTSLGMTPQYAAPEQVRGEPVTTATDVYALGVLLYELLTGRRPYDVSQRSPAEIERIVCDFQPPLPSMTLNGGDALARARQRQTTPDRLRRRLRGDLDTIVAKAMKKNPAERYPTVAALAEDLRRTLQHEAIAARPDSTAYKAAKFARRYRRGLVLTIAAGFAMIIVSVREYRLRSVAEVETRTAQSVERYLLSVFGTADPFLSTDTSAAGTTARELLDHGTARLDTVLATDPRVRSRIRTALGRVYANLGLYEKASRQLEVALAEQRAVEGDRTPAGAAILEELGFLRDRQGRIAEADSLLVMALDRHRARSGSADSAIATTLERLSVVRRERNEYESAEALIREALAIRQRLHGDNALPTSMSQQSLADVLHEQGNDSAAAPLFRAALATRASRLGRGQPLVAETMFRLALTERRLGRIAAAESLYREALDIQRRTLGADHPNVASTLNGLADLLHKAASRSDEAEALLREALAINRRRLGEQHGEVSTNLGNLAVIARERGDYAEAEKLLGQALHIDEAMLGPDHNYVAYDLNEIATILRMRGRSDSATVIFRRVLAMNRKVGGEGHRNTLAVKVQLGRALRETGRFSEAAEVFREALTHLAADNADTDPFKVGARVGLGRSLVRVGKSNEALELLQGALAYSSAKFGATNARTAEAHLGLGESLGALGRMPEARAALDSARAILEPQRRAQPVLVQEVERELRRVGRRAP
jgi:serine/threonine-protein kinase